MSIPCCTGSSALCSAVKFSMGFSGVICIPCGTNLLLLKGHLNRSVLDLENGRVPESEVHRPEGQRLLQP